MIVKLFFNVDEDGETGVEEDPATLKNELDSVKCQLRVKDGEKTELRNANTSLLVSNSSLKQFIWAISSM